MARQAILPGELVRHQATCLLPNLLPVSTMCDNTYASIWTYSQFKQAARLSPMQVKILSADGKEPQHKPRTAPTLPLNPTSAPVVPEAYKPELVPHLAYITTQRSVQHLCTLAKRLADPAAITDAGQDSSSLIAFKPPKEAEEIDIDLGFVLALLGRDLLAAELCEPDALIVVE